MIVAMTFREITANIISHTNIDNCARAGSSHIRSRSYMRVCLRARSHIESDWGCDDHSQAAAAHVGTARLDLAWPSKKKHCLCLAAEPLYRRNRRSGKHMTLAGLEPAIFGSEDQRLTH